jgi:uncharacterized protein (TIGR02145 family)
MRAKQFFSYRKAFAFLVIWASLFACEKDPLPLPPPLPPLPPPSFNSPQVRTSEVSGVSFSEAEVYGQIISDGGAKITERGFCWGTDSNEVNVNSNKRRVTATTTNFSLNLTGLNRNTKYYVKAYAINDVGVAYGQAVEVYTYDIADNEGNMYHTVKIGEQVWTMENLRTRHYNNGDSIIHEPIAANWGPLETGAYTAYNNSSEMAEKYGYLYNYLAVTDSRGIAPEGWRIPSGYDFEDLKNFLGGYYLAGPALMNKLGWPETLRTITNSTNFSALPNGGIARNLETGLYEYSGGDETAAFITNEIFGGYLIMVIISAEEQFLSTGGLYGLSAGAGIRLIKQ